MRIKKYVADSMPEALKQIKAELGPKAVILNTRTLQKSGAFGLGNKGQVEVTAAVDTSPPSKNPAPKTQSVSAPVTSKPNVLSSALPKRTVSEAPPDAVWVDRIAKKIDGLEAALRSGAKTGGEKLLLPGALDPLAQQMERAGLLPDLAQDVLKTILIDPGPTGLKDLGPLQKRAAELLSRWFETPAPIRLGKGVRSVVALVGPTGVGKTTAVARIAAHFASHNTRTVMVAADTDRVGGLEQIRAYASILGMPVEVAYTPEDIGDIIRQRKDVDLILIDTAGAGPLGKEHLSHLQALFQEAMPNEIHLTLSASTDLNQMRDVVAAFLPLGINRLLLTKIDETVRLGTICSLAIETKMPLSYTTHGRAVPGDLRPANPQEIVHCLFERVSLNGTAG
jgi:flagellar biosynthesis protein FlhF